MKIVIFYPKMISSTMAKQLFQARTVVRLVIIYVGYDIRQVFQTNFVTCDSL